MYIVTDVISTSYRQLIEYIPSLAAGLVLVGIGFLAGTLTQQLLRLVLRILALSRIPKLLGTRVKHISSVWPDIACDLIGLSVLVLFLVPALDAWKLPQLARLVNNVLIYVPNIFAAYFIIFLGYLGGLVVRNTLESYTGTGLAMGVQSALFAAAGLIALSQLGVAQDFVKLLFGGIILFIALAGGIAFGLGGKDIAHDILMQLKNKIQRRHRLEA